MPIDPKDWYEASPDFTLLTQGDVVDNVPTVRMPPSSDRWTLLRPAPPVTVAAALAGATPKSYRPQSELVAHDPWASGQELVLAKGTKQRVMLVNHDCDLEHRKYFQLAPVYGAVQLGEAKRDSLKVNEITYAFFLPASAAELPDDCFADLSQITAVHRSYVREAILLKRLSARARLELQRHLGTFYGRPFGFNPKDTVTATGEYVCANCFFSRAALEFSRAGNGARFPPCARCGDDALWVRTPVRFTGNWISRMLIRLAQRLGQPLAGG